MSKTMNVVIAELNARMTYYCQANNVWSHPHHDVLDHCANHDDAQCPSCAKYQSGIYPPNYPVPAIWYAYSYGFYGDTERNLIEARYNACSDNNNYWFMFELYTDEIVMTDCPCCQK